MLPGGDQAGNKKRRLLAEAAFCSIVTREEESLVLGRSGSDLLSQGLSHSTIGAEEFNGRVRDGIGFKLLAETTRPAKDKAGFRNRGVRRQDFPGRRPRFLNYEARLDISSSPGIPDASFLTPDSWNGH
jgi:hypothetical protein